MCQNDQVQYLETDDAGPADEEPDVHVMEL